MKKLLLILTILSLSVNADPVEDVWDWANDNPIATAANRVTSVASNDILPNDAVLADLPTVSTAYPDKSSTAVSPIICSKALENSAMVSGVTVAIVSPTAARCFNKICRNYAN
jgi:hypothetical protein